MLASLTTAIPRQAFSLVHSRIQSSGSSSANGHSFPAMGRPEHLCTQGETETPAAGNKGQIRRYIDSLSHGFVFPLPQPPCMTHAGECWSARGLPTDVPCPGTFNECAAAKVCESCFFVCAVKAEAPRGTGNGEIRS